VTPPARTALREVLAFVETAVDVAKRGTVAAVGAFVAIVVLVGVPSVVLLYFASLTVERALGLRPEGWGLILGLSHLALFLAYLFALALVGPLAAFGLAAGGKKAGVGNAFALGFSAAIPRLTLLYLPHGAMLVLIIYQFGFWRPAFLTRNQWLAIVLLALLLWHVRFTTLQQIRAVLRSGKDRGLDQAAHVRLPTRVVAASAPLMPFCLTPGGVAIVDGLTDLRLASAFPMNLPGAVQVGATLVGVFVSLLLAATLSAAAHALSRDPPEADAAAGA
jgi:hypothetical protein